MPRSMPRSCSSASFCADVDPRGDASYINYISDKATSVGGGVLEALAMLTGVFQG